MNRRNLLCLLFIFAWSQPVTAQDEEAAKKKAEMAAVQKKMADELWKKVFDGRPFVFKETDNFLLYGTVEEMDLEKVGQAVEKQFPAIKKAINVGPKDELWGGKLLVYVIKERTEFGVFLRNVQKIDRVEKDYTGGFKHEKDYSYITAGPPGRNEKLYPIDVEVIRQLASATLTKKTQLPEWFVTGFGRATAYRYSPKDFAAERQKAALYVRQGKTAKNVWAGNQLSADEALVLNASFIDFLANGPAPKAFQDVLAAMGAETPFEDALKSAKINPDAVDQSWRRWALIQK